MRRPGLEGPEQIPRKGKRDRRGAFWVTAAVIALVFYLAGAGTGVVIAAGIPADALAESDAAQAQALEDLQGPILRELAAVRDSLIANPRIVEREVRVPYPVVETQYLDTLYLPGPAPPAEVVEVAVVGPPVPGPVRVLEIPTPQPAGVCFDPHSFTSGQTFRPSIGTFGWGLAGFLAGLLVSVEAVAEAEVYVQ